MNKTYMLNTNICSFIMREQPDAVIRRLERAVLRNHRIVIAAITGHALAAVLVTNNTREFARVPDLNVEGWVKLPQKE